MNDISQIRNFKDFLQLYNRVTELCFGSCVDNFFNRNLSEVESSCVSKCVEKFTNVNHKMLGIYVELQGEITQRRIAEYEAQQKADFNKNDLQLPESQIEPIPDVDVSNTTITEQ